MIEAFYKRVPVLAFAATAVPATMDGGGVLVRHQGSATRSRGSWTPSSTIRRIEEAVLASQDAALERLHGAGLRRNAAALRRRDAQRRPPRPAPEVAWDFWLQFDQFERLEELRQFRPALYRALPQEPGLGTRRSTLEASDEEMRQPAPRAHPQ